MQEVIPKHLWIGNATEVRDVRAILGLGVLAVIDLAIEETPVQFPRDIVYCRLPLLDGGGNQIALLRAAVDITARFLDANIPAFVFCGAGMSRSPAIVAAAMATVRQQPFDTALRGLTVGHSHDVSPILWNAIKAACGE